MFTLRLLRPILRLRSYATCSFYVYDFYDLRLRNHVPWPRYDLQRLRFTTHPRYDLTNYATTLRYLRFTTRINVIALDYVVALWLRYYDKYDKSTYMFYVAFTLRRLSSRTIYVNVLNILYIFFTLNYVYI